MIAWGENAILKLLSVFVVSGSIYILSSFKCKAHDVETNIRFLTCPSVDGDDGNEGGNNGDGGVPYSDSDSSDDSSDGEGSDPKNIIVSSSTKNFNIVIFRFQTVAGLKKVLRKITGIKRRHIRLLLGIHELEDIKRLTSYGIKNGDVVQMVILTKPNPRTLYIP